MTQDGNVKRRMILDIIIVAIVGGSIIFATVNYFYRPAIKEPYYVEVEDTPWKLNIVFTSYDVFGARTPLLAEVTAWSDFSVKADPVFLYFPEATHNPPRYSEYDEMYTPGVEMYQDEEDYKYRGSETIVFRSEGMKHAIFSEAYLHPVPTELLRANATGQFDLIHISSENAKLEYETNKAMVFLGIVAAALGVASVCDILQKFIRKLGFHDIPDKLG